MIMVKSSSYSSSASGFNPTNAIIAAVMNTKILVALSLLVTVVLLYRPTFDGPAVQLHHHRKHGGEDELMPSIRELADADENLRDFMSVARLSLHSQTARLHHLYRQEESIAAAKAGARILVTNSGAGLQSSERKPAAGVDDVKERQRQMVGTLLQPSASGTTASPVTFLLVTGERPTVCKTKEGAEVLLMSYKNKVDFCSVHGCKVWYMLESWEEGFYGVWARYPALLRLMLSLPSVEWFMWMDADAVFTDFNFTIPFKQYDEWNKKFIAHGFNHLLYGEQGNWFSLNAGIFLIRNCEWSHEFLRLWRTLGLREMRSAARRAFNAEIKNRPPELRADDQSALVYLLRKARNETEERVHMEAAYYLHGYWELMVDRYEEMVQKGRAAMKDDDQWPLTTHFCGCSFCSAPNVEKRCLQGFHRAYHFGDNQFLDSLHAHLRHLDFNSSVLSPVNYG